MSAIFFTGIPRNGGGDIGGGDGGVFRRLRRAAARARRLRTVLQPQGAQDRPDTQ